MERSVGLERTYRLGEFRSLKVSDSVSNIAEELATNGDFMRMFKWLQLISAEKLYYEYASLTGELNLMEENEEKIEYLSGIETDLYTKLVGLMTQKIGQEESE